METMTALALDIMRRARGEHVVVKALGGVAICLLCTEAYALYPGLSRTPADIDLAGMSEDSSRIEAIVADFGFTPCTEFNFLNSGERMKFLRDEVQLDVFLDRFRMCHTWSLRDRLSKGSDWTLPLGDLLLTKLQVVRPAGRDLLDLAALFVFFDQSVDKTREEAAQYVARLTSRHWGLHHTCRLRLSDATHFSLPESNHTLCRIVTRSAGILTRAMESRRKGVRWRLRATLGPRLRWYAEPEE